MMISKLQKTTRSVGAMRHMHRSGAEGKKEHSIVAPLHFQVKHCWTVYSFTLILIKQEA
ncbi:unnamed protein product [Arctogadus glacialis]